LTPKSKRFSQLQTRPLQRVRTAVTRPIRIIFCAGWSLVAASRYARDAGHTPIFGRSAAILHTQASDGKASGGLDLASRLSPAMHVPAAPVRALTQWFLRSRIGRVTTLPCNLTSRRDWQPGQHAAGVGAGHKTGLGPPYLALGVRPRVRPSFLRNSAAVCALWAAAGDAMMMHFSSLLAALSRAQVSFSADSNRRKASALGRHVKRFGWLNRRRQPFQGGPAARHKRTGSADKRTEQRGASFHSHKKHCHSGFWRPLVFGTVLCLELSSMLAIAI
jgi:hypothetical protein